MVHIIRERDPIFEEELPAGFRPLSIEEGNLVFRGVLPDGTVKPVHRRVRVIRFVSLDQSCECETVSDLGPATDADPLFVPCSGAVEMAEAIDLFLWAKQKSDERAAREAWVKPLRDQAFLLGIAASNEEAARRAVGSSSFGPMARVQRERTG